MHTCSAMFEWQAKCDHFPETLETPQESPLYIRLVLADRYCMTQGQVTLQMMLHVHVQVHS